MHLGRASNQRLCKTIKPGPKTLAAFGEDVPIAHAAIGVECVADIVPGRPGFLVQFRIGRNLAPQLLLGCGARRDNGRVDKRSKSPLAGLERIFDAEQHPFGDARLFGAARGELREHAAQLGIVEQGARQAHVTLEFEFGDGVEAIGASGMAGRKGQLARPHVLHGVAQVVCRAVERMVVGIDAKIGHVEVVAGEFEIVGVAAKERDGHFRGEDEPNILVAPVAVEIVDAAVIEVDDIASYIAVAARTFARDCRFDRLLRIGKRLSFLAGDCGCDPAGDIGDAGELVDLDIRALALVSRLLGIETRRDQVGAGGRKLLDAALRAMMVGLDQAGGRDEACRTAPREPQR